jgi:hypothetical protein
MLKMKFTLNLPIFQFSNFPIFQFSNILIFSIFSIVIFLSSCKKDSVYTSSSAKLEFYRNDKEADTIIFDTVFTTIGSITEWLTVKNPYNKKLIVSNIYLAGGDDSNFRINIDGHPQNSMKDVEIAANDSIFIFIEVTVDPNGGSNPLIITDSIVFETNGNIQDVQLVAWGQDAYFYAPEPGEYFYPFDCAFSTLPTDKPNVFYGYAYVQAGCILSIPAGARLYFHSYSGIAADSAATILVQGTSDNPVTFQGDRLEEYYEDIAGQWGHPLIGGIWFYPGSVNNEIDYAIIKNGYIGIQVDTLGNSTNPTLTINNTIIHNMASIGILGQGTKLKATNCVITNCAQGAIWCYIGGDYDYRHCTIANYWSGSSRQTPSLVLNNWYKDVDENIQIRDLSNAYFGNCIIYGNLESELGFDENENGAFNYTFDHCLFKVGTDINITGSNFINVIPDIDPLFENIDLNDFRIDTLSPAKDTGNVTIANSVPTDITGANRLLDGKPDLGAYEVP